MQLAARPLLVSLHVDEIEVAPLLRRTHEGVTRVHEAVLDVVGCQDILEVGCVHLHGLPVRREVHIGTLTWKLGLAPWREAVVVLYLDLIKVGLGLAGSIARLNNTVRRVCPVVDVVSKVVNLVRSCPLCLVQLVFHIILQQLGVTRYLVQLILAEDVVVSRTIMLRAVVVL